MTDTTEKPDDLAFSMTSAEVAKALAVLSGTITAFDSDRINAFIDKINASVPGGMHNGEIALALVWALHGVFSRGEKKLSDASALKMTMAHMFIIQRLVKFSAEDAPKTAPPA
jgi:hypothetical protein